MQRLELGEFDRALDAGVTDGAAQKPQGHLLRQPEKSRGVEFDARALGPVRPWPRDSVSAACATAEASAAFRAANASGQ